MRLLRLAAAVGVPAVLAWIAFSSAAAGALIAAGRSEEARATIVGSGQAFAIVARAAAARREPPGVIAGQAFAATAASPLYGDAFVAAAAAVDQPELVQALLEHARALTRRDRPLLELLARRATADHDLAAATTYRDEMFQQATGIEPGYAALAESMNDPAARAVLATRFAAGASWRARFFGQLDPSPLGVRGVALLLADVQRRGGAIPVAELAPMLQRLANGSVGQKVAGWRLWTMLARPDPFAWPVAELQPAAIPYQWTIADDAAGDVQFAGEGLTYRVEGSGGVVLRKLTALSPGSYRVRIGGSDPGTRLGVTCGERSVALADGTDIRIGADCPVQALDLTAPGGQGAIRGAALTPVP